MTSPIDALPSKADTGDRTIRDRLAEALYCGDYLHGGWEWAPAGVINAYRARAERVLASLPTVGLRIGEAG